MRLILYKTIIAVALSGLLLVPVNTAVAESRSWMATTDSLDLFPDSRSSGESSFRDKSVRERIFVGGFIGLQFGTFTSVNITAQAGYRITKRFSAGVGSSYQYESSNWLGTSFSSHIYGGSVFARYRVYAGAFIHAENEWLSFQSRLPGVEPADRPRLTETNTLLGLGYGLPLSEKVRLNILLLYNLNDNSQVYYDNPFFRVGVDIGL